jgi:hypothetical protein
MKVLRLPFKRGALVWEPDRGQALIVGRSMFATNLSAVLRERGRWMDEFDFGSGLVTTAGVVYLAADFAAGASDINAMNYHAVGIGASAAVIGDTALGNVTGAPARVAGAQTTPGATNIYQSVATVSFVSTLAITEWGLFSASSAGTLWDRKVFTAINVVSGDSIQFTYQLTCTAGG